MRLHIWLETKDGVIFGLGRFMLLEQVHKLGSLKKAAEQLGMSYRAAWGKIQQSEKEIGFKLLEKGKSKREGYKLTTFGHLLLESYRSWFDDVEKFALNRAREVLPLTPRSFEKK